MPGNHQVAPFPCWSGMMTRVWQNRAKQLWIEKSDKSVSEEQQQKIMKQWMMMMSNAWKALVGETSQQKDMRRWREAVINCCNKLKNSAEEKNSDNQDGKDVDKDASSSDDTSGAEGEKQEEKIGKRKLWRQTMKQCWNEADKKEVKERATKERRCRSETHVDHRQQWRQMMRGLTQRDCPTTREEMKVRKQIMKQWWRNARKANDQEKTSDSSSNESAESEEDADYINISVDSDTDLNIKGMPIQLILVNRGVKLLSAYYQLKFDQDKINSRINLNNVWPQKVLTVRTYQINPIL